MKLHFSLLLLTISALTCAQDTLLTDTAWHFKKEHVGQSITLSSLGTCSPVKLPYQFTSHNLLAYKDTLLVDGVFLQHFTLDKIQKGSVYILSVDYVGNQVEVFINNEKLKVLEGMTGACVNVSQALVQGKNTIQLLFRGSTRNTDFALDNVKIVSTKNFVSINVDVEKLVSESALEATVGLGTRLFASSCEKGNYIILHTLYAPDGKMKGQRSIKVKHRAVEKNEYYKCKPLKVFNPEISNEELKMYTVKTEILQGCKNLDSKSQQFHF